MTSFEFGSHQYGFTVASDVSTRDGLGVELGRLGTPSQVVLEIFRSDEDGSYTVTLFEPLPLELVERSIAFAKHRFAI